MCCGTFADGKAYANKFSSGANGSDAETKRKGNETKRNEKRERKKPSPLRNWMEKTKENSHFCEH